MIESNEIVMESERASLPIMDSRLPGLERSFDPTIVDSAIRTLLCEDEADGLGTLMEIQLLRHRPGRRCVIAFQFGEKSAGSDSASCCYVGKISSKGANRRSDGVARRLRRAGFSETGPHCFTVAEPIGLVPDLGMTLQRFYPGPCMTELVAENSGQDRFEMIGVALAELHASDVVTDRCHTVGTELAILEERLPRVGRAVAKLSARIERLVEASRCVAERLAGRTTRPIHRDFYPDQIIDSAGQLVLLDLDLFTMGDAALDVGNFLAHLKEQGLRMVGDENRFAGAMSAFEKGYQSISSASSSRDVADWTHLSLLRHIDISWRIDARRGGLESVVDCCERSLRALRT